MPLEVPVKQTGLEASIDAAAKKAGRSLSINIGKSAKSIDTLSQPLGRITGRADEFTKSMEAANARVLAFGASVGVLTTVTRAFKELVTTTISVEKQLTSINTILGGTASSLSEFSSEIFNVARNTEQSFAVVAEAALELSRQGLESEQVIKRLNDALILSRLTGQGAAEAVSGLTAAINSFNSSGITSSEVLNKLSSAAISAAVSERDLIEGIKRSGAVAVQAGVSFDELVGIIGAVQEKTARGGAVIGNSFKTIFTRIQSLDKLETMQNLGVQVTDTSGEILSATKLIQNLGKTLEKLPSAKRLQIAEGLVGKFQIAPFLSILEDFNSQQSIAIELTGISQNASTEAYERNITLNKTLSAAINQASVSLTELANNLGKIGVTDGLKQILDTVNGALQSLTKMFDEKSGSNIAKNLVKGIGNVLSGPGVAIFLAIIGKLTFELAKFGVGSLKTFFGINKAAKEQAALQGSIASSLLNNSSIQKQILSIENSTLSVEGKRAAQVKFFTTALNEQYGIMLKMQQIAGRVAPGVMAGTTGRGRGRAGGYIPNFAGGFGAEMKDISAGVGGAPPTAKAVTIPNFNFGGGMVGPVVANDSEFLVPNFGGGGGSAIFNQDMASSMGLPAGARKINASEGLFTGRGVSKGVIRDDRFAMIVPQQVGTMKGTGTAGGKTYGFNIYGFNKGKLKSKNDQQLKADVRNFGVNLANSESRTLTKGSPTADKIDKLGNAGAVGGLAGVIFEAAVSALTKRSKDFTSKQTSTFDFFGSEIAGLRELYPNIPNSVFFAEAKIRAGTDLKNSMASKMHKFGAGAKTGILSGKATKEFMGSTKSPGLFQPKGIDKNNPLNKQMLEKRMGMKFAPAKARGYIPNFSNGTRGGFVSPSARSATPSGFGQFDRNTIQEQKKYAQSTKDAAAGTQKVAKAQRDLLGPIFAAQIAMSAFSGATSDATSGFGLTMNRVSSGLSSLTTAAFAGVAINSLGDSFTNAKGEVNKFGSGLKIAGGIAAGFMATAAIMDTVNKMHEDSTGITKANNVAVAKMTDAVNKATISLNTLSEVEKVEVDEQLTEAFGGDTGMAGQLGKALFSFVSTGAKEFGHGDLFTQVEAANQAAGTVQVTQSQQKAIRETSKQAVAAMMKGEGLTTSEAIKRVEAIVREEAGRSLAAGNIDFDFTGGEGGAGMEEGILIANAKEVAAIQDRLLNIFQKQNDEKKEQLDKLKAEELAAQKLKDLQETKDRVTASLAKESVRVAVEKAKLQNDGLDLVKDQIKTAQIMGEISAEDLIRLEHKRDILAQEKEFRNLSLNSVLKMVNTTQELTMVSEDEKKLRQSLLKSSKDGVISEQERSNIIHLTNELLKEGTSIKATEIRQLQNDIDLGNIKLNQAKERLAIEKNIAIAGALFKRDAAGDAAAGRTATSRRFQSEQAPLESQIKQLDRITGGMGLGAQTILQGRGTSVGKSNIGLTKTILENQLSASKLLQSQIKEASQFLQGADFDATAEEAEFLLRGSKTSKDIQEVLKKEILGTAKGDKRFFDSLNQQADELVDGFDKSTAANKLAANSALDLAKNSQLAARALGDLLTEDEIKEDMATRLREGKNQAMVDARLSIDPAARAKGLFSAGRRERKAKALDDNDETLFRQLLQEELLAGQLIDASQQFAHNIGNAMLDAISKGENLGDTLLNAASGFFDQMSRALMNNAVNSIIGGGPGGAGFFGGFGKLLGLNTGGRVSGGSGVRDDVPALLTGGEFVMNKKAVQNYGSGFMGALNSGAVPKYANGGLFTPGTYGQGSIKGSSNLLNFATQSYTGGMQDQFLAGAGVAGLALEPQSGRLTMLGRSKSPAFQKEQDSKRKAFDLFAQQYSKDAERRKQKEQNSGKLLGSILGFGFSLGANALFGGGLSGIFSKGKATGGAIPYSAGIDSVPAMLSGGEFVMNAAATQRLGAGNLATLNSGGGVGSGDSSQIVGKLDQLNETISSSNTEINITVNSNGTENTDSPNAPEQQRNLATRIKDVVRQVIEDEKRLGGSLRMA